jgi:hypothetical protein
MDLTALYDVSGANINFLSFLNLLFTLNHQIAWRFICASVIISPVFLCIVLFRMRFNPHLRSRLLGACLVGLFLPYQRSIFFLFDDIFSATYRASKIIQLPNPLGGGDAIDIFEIISFVWLIGFLFFCIVRVFDYGKTMRKFCRKEIPGCAAYFHNFSSKIYLPPDFESAYTCEEQEMLLAHERQHIVQHDPLLFRFLIMLECFFWFNPLILKVVRLFQHERELLCDERVTSQFSKHDYGLLILKAAQRKPALRATAGIVSEGSIKERVKAMVTPIVSICKKTTAAIVFLAALLFVTGIIGFRPAWFEFDRSSLLTEDLGFIELYVSAADKIADFPAEGRIKSLHINGMENYIETSKNGMQIDSESLYKYAASLGLHDNQWIKITHINAYRPDWGGGAISYETSHFQVSDFNTREPILVSYKKTRSFYQKITEFLL